MIAYCFIFARGGSKGLPKKNVKELNGKPLLHYSIETALDSPSISEVFVSTEDSEIAHLARQGGATVIDRPAELATDSSPEWLSWRHAVNWVIDNRAVFDCFVSLPATSPLRSVDDVESAIKKSREDNIDICISVTEAARSPYFNMVKFSDNNSQVELVCSSNSVVVRRQDAPVVYDVTTVVYAARPEFILESDSVFSGNVGAIKIPKHRAIDIDDIYDFQMAESILNYSEISNA